MHLRFLNNCSQLASHHEPLSTRRRTVTCGWRFVGRPKVAQLYVRIGFFIKFILFYYQEYGNWKVTSSIGSYRNKHPQPNTGCVDPEGVRWSAPYPPHPPKKSHVLWVSIEISIPRHPKINKNTVTPPSQTQRVQLFSGILNVHRGNTYETFSLHLQNSIRDGEVGNYLFLTDVRIQRGIGGPDTPPPKKKINK